MSTLNFAKMNGLVPAIVQDHKTREVLMLGFMNEEAWKKTIETGKTHFYSRSRKKLWMKGETSGNIQIIKDIFVDCDEDSVLVLVEQLGSGVCHEGYKSCFYRKFDDSSLTKK